jgi:hypothetical protein
VFVGPDVPPPSKHDPNVQVEWNLWRAEDGAWISHGSAVGPSWMPDTLNDAVIWIAWVVFGFGQPQR